MEGLSNEEAARRLKAYGYNEIKEKKEGWLHKAAKAILTPISLMLLLAAALSYFIDKLFDAYFILFLLSVNLFIGVYHEKKADDAIEKLKKRLAVFCRVMRNGSWQQMESKSVVIGDVVEVKVGSIVPADMKVLGCKNLSVNESMLTGESLPAEKKQGDTLFSGSFIATGWAKGEVTATGAGTYFGKTVSLVDTERKRSAMEEDILGISKLLSGLSILAVIMLTIVFLAGKRDPSELVILDLSLLIAGIPVALPAVMTLITSIGVMSLAEKEAVVRRLSSLEDLANVNLLLTDKTGTLTKNEIEVQSVLPYGKSRRADVLAYASMAASDDPENTINQSIVKKAAAEGAEARDYSILDFIPADSERKRNTVFVKIKGAQHVVTTGAPQVVASLCELGRKEKAAFERDVKNAAQDGFRVIAVAVGRGRKEEKMELSGLLLLSDTLRGDAKDAIAFLRKNGIEVKMITGDNRFISRHVAEELGLKGILLTRKGLEKFPAGAIPRKLMDSAGVFSEILPADKFSVVKSAKAYYRVGVTGDGVNDMPSLRLADAGIAVSNAVDAAKSAADIVLLSTSLSVIQDAIIEARKIFARVYSYSIYRISESFRLIIAIAILGIIYGEFPLTPVQIMLIAILNDLPIISLAFNRVDVGVKPAKVNARQRAITSSVFGTVGVVNSLLMFLIANNLLHLPVAFIQTLFFLKLTVSGHLLIYVAHTKERWFRYLPSAHVVAATLGTQLIATLMAAYGIFMEAIPLEWIAFVWLWSFFWMQVGDVTKVFVPRKD